MAVVVPALNAPCTALRLCHESETRLGTGAGDRLTILAQAACFFAGTARVQRSFIWVLHLLCSPRSCPQSEPSLCCLYALLAGMGQAPSCPPLSCVPQRLPSWAAPAGGSEHWETRGCPQCAVPSALCAIPCALCPVCCPLPVRCPRCAVPGALSPARCSGARCAVPGMLGRAQHGAPAGAGGAERPPAQPYTHPHTQGSTAHRPVQTSAALK